MNPDLYWGNFDVLEIYKENISRSSCLVECKP